MARPRHTAKQGRATNGIAVTALAGLGLSLTGSASATAIQAAVGPQSDDILPNQRFVLGEEEMADVSLATFHLFDKESAGSGLQLAAVVVRGCRGCGGCRSRLPWVWCWLAWLRWLCGMRRLLRALGTVPLVLSLEPPGRR